MNCVKLCFFKKTIRNKNNKAKQKIIYFSNKCKLVCGVKRKKAHIQPALACTTFLYGYPGRIR
jgi:hypothetical protein